MNQKFFKQVRRFVSDMTLKPIEQIKPESSLLLDLDVTAETAPSFFHRFGEEFHVDLQEVDLGPYFLTSGADFPGGEAATALWMFWFFTNERHQFRGVKPLLVSDLVRMAQTKRWCVG